MHIWHLLGKFLGFFVNQREPKQDQSGARNGGSLDHEIGLTID